MKEEERWEGALHAETEEPSQWEPELDALVGAYRQHLRAKGCSWDDLAVAVVLAQRGSRYDRATFAARLGLSEEQLTALEGG